MNNRPLKIDDKTRTDHKYLLPDDRCFYFGEYTSGGGYGCSVTNDLIQNLKKPVDRKGRPEYRHKESAISRIGKLLCESISKKTIEECIFVPLPPSKQKGDPLYDDRIAQILGHLQKIGADVREIITQAESREAFHLGRRLPPEDLAQQYDVDASLILKTEKRIILFDDVVTTGCHFRAAKSLLAQYVSDDRIVGLFIARVAREPIGNDLE